jgi:urate oxidase
VLSIASPSCGVSGVRLMRVCRRADPHQVHDLAVSIRVQARDGTTQSAGTNAEILDSKTMENAIFALAKDTPPEIGEEQLEQFGQRLADYFMDNHAQLARVSVDLAECPWERLPVGARPHQHAFSANIGGGERTASVHVWRGGATVASGFFGVKLLRTVSESFSGFQQDPFASAPVSSCGLLACQLGVTWLYGAAEPSFALCYQGVRQLVLEAFASQQSHSVQHLLHAIGEAALSGYDEISEVRLALERFQHELVDLSRFGLENRDEVFQARAEPSDRFELTVLRQPEGAPPEFP